VDRVGRLQLPHEYMAALELRDRVRLALEPDHLSVWPGTAQRKPETADAERPKASEPDSDRAERNGDE
jgi:hypothetical protein